MNCQVSVKNVLVNRKLEIPILMDSVLAVLYGIVTVLINHGVLLRMKMDQCAERMMKIIMALKGPMILVKKMIWRKNVAVLEKMKANNFRKLIVV